MRDRRNKKSNLMVALIILAPPAGLEPATYGLTVRRSTDWTKEELRENADDYKDKV